jgi:tetratricopeptide (TPR) repeat protein
MAVSFRPDYWRGHYKKGVALYYLSQLEESKNSLEEALELKNEDAGSNHFIGMVYLAQNEPGTAYDYLIKASVLDSVNVDIWFHLGQACMRLENWSDSEKYLQRSTQLDERNKEAFYSLGQVYQKINEPDKSRRYLASFKKLSDFEQERDALLTEIRVRPGELHLYRKLAILYGDHGYVVDAAEVWKKSAYLGDEEAIEELTKLKSILEQDQK